MNNLVNNIVTEDEKDIIQEATQEMTLGDALREELSLSNVDTKVIEFKFNTRYLSDHKDELRMIMNHKLSLLRSDTGTGKSYLFKELLTEDDKHRYKIITVPSKRHAKRFGIKYNVPYVTGEVKKLDFIQLENANNVIVCVWDSLPKVYKLLGVEPSSLDMIVIDEVHQCVYDSGFRMKSIKALLSIVRVTDCIMTTGTDDTIRDWDGLELIIDCIGEKFNNYEMCYFKAYEENEDREVISSIIRMRQLDSNMKYLVHNNSINKQERLSKTLEKLGFRVAILNANTKDTQVSKLLENSGILDCADVYLTTSVIEAGLDIENENKFCNIYVFDNNKSSLEKMKQACARLRTCNHICIIISKYNNEIVTQEQLLQVNKEEEKIEMLALIEDMNNLIKRYSKRIDDASQLMKGWDVNECVVFNKDLNQFEFSELRYKKSVRAEKDRVISSNHELFKSVVMNSCVNSDNYRDMTNVWGIDEDVQELHKESKDELKEEKHNRNAIALTLLTQLDDMEYDFYENKLITGTNTLGGIKANDDIIRVVDMLLGNRDVTKVANRALGVGIDIREVASQLAQELGEGLSLGDINDIIRVEEYLNYNELYDDKMIDLIASSKSELKIYHRKRAIINQYNSKDKKMPMSAQVEFYKIDNPKFKSKKLNDEQQQKVLKSINEIANARISNKRIIITSIKKRNKNNKH